MKRYDMPYEAETTCCESVGGSGKFRCRVLVYVARKYMKREEAQAPLADLAKEIEALKEQIRELKKERQI